MTDRELDLQIATKLFQHKVRDVPVVPSQVNLILDYFTDEAYDQIRKTYPQSLAPRLVPHYSTNYCAFKAVLDKLSKYCYLTISNRRSVSSGALSGVEWHVEAIPFKGDTTYNALDISLTRAGCLVALQLDPSIFEA